MLGWEFPPCISGGLGTACQGIVGGLAAAGAEVLFVVPRLFGGEEGGGARLFAAGDVPLAPDAGAGVRAPSELSDRLQLAHVDSALRPYHTAPGYAAFLRRLRRDAPPARQADRHPAARAEPFEGGYGPTLATEVERYARAIAELARREPFDVVHAHDWMTFPAGLLARRVSGRPLVCHFHSCEHDRNGAGVDPGIVAIEQAALDRADRVVCVSHFERGVLAANYRVHEERTVVVHNAVAAGRAAARRSEQPDRPPTVLFLGRLTRQKGPGFFLDAAARVAARRPDVRFVVSGDGELRDELIESAAALGIGRSVFFTGFLGPADVERAYAEADVYVMPSASEPFGLTPLEALSLDTPVIVSRQSGVAEMLSSSPKVDFGDVEDLAAKVLFLLERPDLRQALVREGREELTALRWEQSAARLVGIYEEVLRCEVPA